MDNIEVLMVEHQNILKFTDLIKNACCQILEGSEVNVSDLRDMIYFARNYADAYHHGKEEKILFRKMLDHLGPLAVKLIQHGMLVEHDMGRLFMTELDAALTRYSEAPTIEDKLAIVTNISAWADHLRRHAEKEDAAVYPFARRTLSAELFAEAEAESVAYETEHAEERGRYLALLDELAEKYQL